LQRYNVGDSRALLVRSGKGIELTQDHRPVGSNKSGRKELDRQGLAQPFTHSRYFFRSAYTRFRLMTAGIFHVANLTPARE
jgi:serine/threonine protein phosphatase PrpC